MNIDWERTKRRFKKRMRIAQEGMIAYLDVVGEGDFKGKSFNSILYHAALKYCGGVASRKIEDVSDGSSSLLSMLKPVSLTSKYIDSLATKIHGDIRSFEGAAVRQYGLLDGRLSPLAEKRVELRVKAKYGDRLERLLRAYFPHETLTTIDVPASTRSHLVGMLTAYTWNQQK